MHTRPRQGAQAVHCTNPGSRSHGLWCDVKNGVCRMKMLALSSAFSYLRAIRRHGEGDVFWAQKIPIWIPLFLSPSPQMALDNSHNISDSTFLICERKMIAPPLQNCCEKELWLDIHQMAYFRHSIDAISPGELSGWRSVCQSHFWPFSSENK